jgi:hypothetical protein
MPTKISTALFFFLATQKFAPCTEKYRLWPDFGYKLLAMCYSTVSVSTTSLIMPLLKLDSFENFSHPTNSLVRLESLHSEGSLAWIKAFSAPSNMSVIKQSDRNTNKLIGIYIMPGFPQETPDGKSVSYVETLWDENLGCSKFTI